MNESARDNVEVSVSGNSTCAWDLLHGGVPTTRGTAWQSLLDGSHQAPFTERQGGDVEIGERLPAPERVLVDPVAALDRAVLLGPAGRDGAKCHPGLLHGRGEGQRKLRAVGALEFAQGEGERPAQLTEEEAARALMLASVEAQDAIPRAVVEGRVLEGLPAIDLHDLPALETDLQLLFLGWASTRTVELMSERLFGRRFSAGEVSAANQRLLTAAEAWRRRSLAEERYVYLFVDGMNFAMRRGETVAQPCVLVALGITERRQRRVLALRAGDKESAAAWRAVFAELVERGFDPMTVQLGVMDGRPGLEAVFRAVCRHAAVQRCQVRKGRNVLVKVRLTARRAVVADLRGSSTPPTARPPSSASPASTRPGSPGTPMRWPASSRTWTRSSPIWPSPRTSG